MNSIEGFVSACARVVGADHVVHERDGVERYERNLSEFRRRVMTVVIPRTAEEVAEVVRCAGEFGVAIHPISRGSNWGLGSRLPNRSGAAVVDLRKMNAIRAVDLEAGTVEVEAGVTQIQLAEALRATPFFIDVTGSGRDTSLVGNALERGVAYNGLRADGLCGLEVVLGTGRLVRTGYGRFPASRMARGAVVGAGPSLEGLFLQSNLGVVTAAVFRLRRRPEYKLGFSLSLDGPARLPALVGKLAELKARGVLPGIPHVFNRERFFGAVAGLYRNESARAGRIRSRKDVESFVGARLRGVWWAVGHLNGEKRIAAAARAILTRELRGFGRLEFMTDRKWNALRGAARLFRRHDDLALMTALESVRGLSCGEPADAGLYSSFWPWTDEADDRRVADPDSGPGGLLYAVAALPAVPRDVEALLGEVADRCRRHGFSPAISLNPVSPGFVEAVLSVEFRRDSADASRPAHECIGELNRRLLARGYPPFRLDLGNQSLAIPDGGAFQDAVQRLKRAFDPEGIIAPGRYGIEPSAE